MDLMLIFGPPGTGKTSADLRIMEQWIAKGTAMEELAYISFQKAAALDGARRFGVSKDQARDLWFKTLHATCFKLLGMTRKQVVTSAWLKAFGKKVGLDIREKDEQEDEKKDAEEYADAVLRMMSTLERSKGTPRGSLYKSMYSLSRLFCRTAEGLSRVLMEPHPKALAYSWPDFTVGAYRGFVDAYEKEKARDGMKDFVDMLADVVKADGSLDLPWWRYAVVDEVQDLSPLQFAVVEKLYFGRSDVVVFSGDDDQAIFSFQGANAQDFLAYRNHPDAVSFTLPQTHRFGQSLVNFAAKITERIKIRQPKDVIGLSGRENPIRDVYSMEPGAVQAGDLLLHRHVAGCAQIAGRLVAAGVPFWNERSGPNPFKHTAELAAFTAWKDAVAGRPITGDALQYLVTKIPSMTADKTRLLHHGAKKKVIGMGPGETVNPSDLKQFFTNDLIVCLRNGDMRHLKCRFADYYERVAAKGYDLSKVPETRVATIHASKGREARRVWLWSELYPKLANAGDDEHRVAYVGATRTMNDLFIVHEAVVGDWTTQYRYPESDGRMIVVDQQ